MILNGGGRASLFCGEKEVQPIESVNRKVEGLFKTPNAPRTPGLT